MSTYGSHEAELRDLYADDEEVEDVWFGRMLEEAREQDRVNALWSDRADAEVAQAGEREDYDL